jgi:glyoxylase-like metal-dependent hydrolase (beta-lactamase superfamily II)
LIPFEGGHTESDAVLWLPQEGIVFMSDLLFIGHQPNLAGGDSNSLLRSLVFVSELEPRLLVPGHGPVVLPAGISQMRGYMQTLDGLAHKLVEDGDAEETIDTMPIPEPCDTWLFASFFPVNMHYLYQLHLGG